MATVTLLRPGDLIGGFRVDDVIGIGGMAIVYRAEQVSLGRPVALKVLSSKLTNDPVFRERFRREGTHAAALEHPNIVPVYDSGEQDGYLYLAMRLVEGTNLAELIQTRGLTADQTIEMLRPIASALDTAHAVGLIHRDVKPQNILITSEGHPYLADFGVAKGSNTYGLTATGGFVGSVNYASPEQINGLTLTPASDVYALTAVLYQCLTGHVPYERETDAGVMSAHLNEPPPTLPSIAGADTDFHTVLARGMAKDPGARYGHAGDLMTAAALCVGRLTSELRAGVPAFPLETKEEQPPEQPPQQRAGATEVVASDELARLRQAASLTAADQRRDPPRAMDVELQPPRGRTRTIAALLAGVIALTAVAAVLLLGGSDHSHQADARVLMSEHIKLSVEPTWKTTSSAAPQGLEIGQAIALTRSGVNAYAGAISKPAPVAGAIPAALQKALGDPNQSSTVKLALGQARRYLWLGSSSAPALTLAVIATEAGDLAIACTTSIPADRSTMLTACSKVLGKAQIIGTTVEYPGADPGLQRQLTAALATRERAPADFHASQLSARANPLERVARSDASAARALGRTQSSARYSAAVSSLAAALHRESVQLSGLALAAKHGQRGKYASLRQHFGTYAGRVSSAGRKLAAFGFTLPRLPLLSIPAPPALPRPRLAEPAPTPTSPAIPTVTPIVQTPAPSTPAHHPAPTPTTVVSVPK